MSDEKTNTPSETIGSAAERPDAARQSAGLLEDKLQRGERLNAGPGGDIPAKPPKDTQRDAARENLSQCWRLWQQCYVQNGHPAVSNFEITQDAQPSAKLEYLARAQLADAITEVCDGHKLGVYKLAVAKLGAVTGDSSHTEQALAEMRMHDTDANQPYTPEAQARHAWGVLQRVRSMPGVNGTEADRVIGELAKGKRRQSTRDEGGERVTVEETPNHLYTLLVKDCGLDADTARVAYEACVVTVNAMAQLEAAQQPQGAVG